MSIPQHVLDQLNERADLVSIIGRHVSLKKSGASFKACCPFHKEKTPSFYVHPQEGYYYCFGCKQTGNAISFLMDYENQSFLEAVETLAAQTGTQIPKNEPSDAFKYTKNKGKTKNAAKPKTKPKTKPKPPSQKVRSGGDNGSNNNSIDTTANPTPDTKTSGTTTVNNQPNEASNPNDALMDINDALAQASGGFIDDFSGGFPSDFSDNFAGDFTNDPVSTTVENTQPAPNKDGNLFELLEKLCDYYQKQLKTHPKALLYLSQRGLNEGTIDHFRLGYAPSDWQHLEIAFPEDIEGLKILGLVRDSDSGRSFDLLRERIIFAIRDARGRVVGFGGRALSNDVQPKYINSPESIVFKKQQILYGLHEGRKARATDWLVVEGYMDVIALHQAGIYGAVASMGTALGEAQLKRLFGLNPKLTLAFDGDNAGQAAAWRALEVALPILEDKIELKFLLLSGGLDPDSFIKAYGKEAFAKLAADALPLSEFLYAQLAKQHPPDNAEGKAQLMAAAKALLSKLPQYGSYRKLLTNDLRERVGLSYGGKKVAPQKLSDTLLDFDARFSSEESLLYLLFRFADKTLEFGKLKQQLDTSSQLSHFFALHEKTKPILDKLSTTEQTHFLLAAWHNPAEQEALSKGLSAFCQTLDDAKIKHSEASAEPSQADWLSFQQALLSGFYLKVYEQALKQQFAKASRIEDKKHLQDEITQVRKLQHFSGMEADDAL